MKWWVFNSVCPLIWAALIVWDHDLWGLGVIGCVAASLYSGLHAYNAYMQWRWGRWLT